MKPVCGNEYLYQDNASTFRRMTDTALLKAIEIHAQPGYYTKASRDSREKAFLRRWGIYLRREARRRELL